jgi:malonyl-ACP O-methyltransferase BioC
MHTKNPPATVVAPGKKRIARAFGLKSPTYEANALFQTAMVNRLLPLIKSAATESGRWIDLGCGTGALLERLSAAAAPGSVKRCFGLDIAREPLRRLKQRTGDKVPAIQGDIDRLPLQKESIEGVIATSVLQWVADPGSVFSSIAAVLSNRGYCAFSLFVNGSFLELFEIRSASGLPLPMRCPEPLQVIKAAEDAGFDIILSEIMNEKRYFPDPIALLKTISGMGGAIAPGKLLTRRELENFCDRYDSTFRESEGVPLTYRALIGICRKRF